MSYAEILHRVQILLQNQAEKFGFFLANPKVPTAKDSPQWIYPPAQLSVALRRSADKILDGKITIFSIDNYVLGATPIWNRDPKTGTLSPLKFGKTLNYRDENVVGDIKYLWEPSRHLHLVSLAQVYAASGEQKYLDGLAVHLSSWMDQCPYLGGPQWTSSLELGIRLINWSIVWQLVGGNESPLFAGDKGASLKAGWLKCIYQHMHFIRGHYSRFSSANNHLIGEASGLYIASLTWPFWPEVETWQQQARSILEQEALQQNFIDGVNKEQAISYQQFVLDFLLLPYLIAKANNKSFSERYLAMIESMLDYLASMMDVGGNLPMIGDADDGYAVKLSAEQDFCPYRSLLASGAVIFQRGDLKHKAGWLDEKTFALLGPAGQDSFQQLVASTDKLPVSTRFSKGGYYMLGSNFERPDEVRMVIDAGPLGYGGIAAHGHADALAIYLSVAGREILVDPGTYAYHTEQKWRDYFRGTSAHNTIRIDGLDQSEIGGNFMWLRKAAAVVETMEDSEEKARFIGSHDGYLSLADPVNHRRSVIFDKNKLSFLVTDEIGGEIGHNAEQFWHFSELCEVEFHQPNRIQVCQGPIQVEMTLDPALDIKLVTANEDMPSGWISRRFDHKQPIVTVVGKARIEGFASLTTELQIKNNS